VNVREKTFDGVVALAIVKQQKLAVACSAIAARVCKGKESAGTAGATGENLTR
jgi:hypothetical protein